jgi:hypothetical protein
MKRTILVLALSLSAVLSAAGGDEPRADQARAQSRTPKEPTPEEVLRSYDERRPDRIPFHFTALRIGTWNVMLQPWLPYEDRVIAVLKKTTLDVLQLEAVWSEEARDRIIAAVGKKYPHAYWVPAAPQLSRCPFTPAELLDKSIGDGGITEEVTEQAIDDYVSCLINTGIDTRTVERPIMPINGLCKFIGLNIALDSQTCFACITNMMQNLPSGDPFGAKNACFAGVGQKLSHQGNVGRLVLSKWPITDIQDVNFDTFLIRRVNTYATIRGVRFVFAHWPANLLYDIDPSLGLLQIGATQADLANDVILHTPRVAIGSFNSGPAYQPDGYNILTQNDYRPLFSQDTQCTAALQDFPPCGDFNDPPNETAGSPKAVDNIFLMKNIGACLKAKFAENDASDHIGLAALCILKTQ